eukprot:5313827-Prymnesium_polylepis.2
MGNYYLTDRRIRPHPSASVHPVRIRPRLSVRPHPVQLFSHHPAGFLACTCMARTQEPNPPIPIPLWTSLAVAAYHMGSSFIDLKIGRVTAACCVSAFPVLF